jgi:phage virion morphogenesis protein
VSIVTPVIRTAGLDALVRKLSRAVDTGVSRRAMTLIGNDLVRSTKRRIASEKRAPDGTPWVAWSDDYEAHKKPGTMLRQSGALHRSIASIVGDDQIEVGSDDIKAAVHQYGHTVTSGPFAGKHIPARPYLGLSDGDEASIHDRIIDDMRRRFA